MFVIISTFTGVNKDIKVDIIRAVSLMWVFSTERKPCCYCSHGRFMEMLHV